jgi:hypothetical protein
MIAVPFAALATAHPITGTVGGKLGARMLAAGVCPKAPPGMQTWADEILSWVKWGVLAILAISFFLSVGMLIWGRVTHHPKGARLGFDGLMICLVGAIIYVVGFVILSSITGNGC